MENIMFERFLFMFHIFIANENGGIDQIDSQFVFPSEEACRIVEAFVLDTRDPGNCILTAVSTPDNDSKDNLNILINKMVLDLKNKKDV